MKISASIYSSKTQKLPEVIKDLDDHQIDFFHVDCSDDPRVFDDLKVIREYSNKPIDLHIITDSPEKYFDLIATHEVEYVTFQYEDLKEPLDIPAHIKAKLGLAITSDTDISVFESFAERFSFILFMATTPGKSAGIFNKENFRKIRKFRTVYPDKKIHVDGGVNGEVSFILRNMGVYSAVSGSYLFNADKLGSALLNLKSNEVDSHFQVRDFMRPIDEAPILFPKNRSFEKVLKSIEDNKLGFTILVNDQGVIEGIISNADVRKGLIRNIADLNNIDQESIINKTPVVINEDATVIELLRHIKSYNFPITYLPVVNNKNIVTGVLTFINLIKGEL
ncbi:MAG TPA: CBS domain-containing protein [Flavobacteriales bacterium]|nr:CBS domain-containing protein [Flavobacteriales bacterium]HIN38779.1 CBS domain-containing protein [Flavobacteriales bacterium]